MTKQDYYNMIDDIIKVSPLATDVDKLQGTRHRILLKAMIDLVYTAISAQAETGDFPFDWTIPSNAFNGYYNSETTFKKGMFKFLHRDVGPRAAMTASNSIREKGSSTATTLTYNIAQGTANVTAYDINGQTFGNPGPLSGTYNVTTPTNVDTSYLLSVVDAVGMTSRANATVSWLNKMYVFTDPNDYSTSSVSVLDAVLNSTRGQLTTSKNSSNTLNASQSIIYIAYPASFESSTPVTIKVNGIQDTSFTGRTFNHTNQFGYVESYKIYQGSNVLSGQYLVETA